MYTIFFAILLALLSPSAKNIDINQSSTNGYPTEYCTEDCIKNGTGGECEHIPPGFQ